jgi:hypothetical protein
MLCGMFETAAAVFFGNLMTLSLVWAMVQFHRLDYRAPWLAYAAFVWPVAYFVISVYLTEAPSSPLDALALR